MRLLQRNPIKTVLLPIAFTLYGQGLAAQDFSVAQLQKNIDIFSGVLAEALGLEQATGLFGISLGGIDNTYLYGQGVVLEVRTSLSSRRNTLGLASLTSTLQNMQSRSNPFAALSQAESNAGSSPRTLALSAANEAEDFYRSMMDRIANVDYSLRFNTALQQASDYARSLRTLGDLEDADYEQLRADLEAIRAEMQTEFARLRTLESELQAVASAAADSVDQADLQSSLDTVLAKLEPLRDRAVAKAEELRERSQQAEQDYAARWQAEVVEFEANLYQAMCDYGSMLHELPADEYVSVILTGLGEEADANRRTDKVHVFSFSDLQQCQSGAIDQQLLQERVTQYSY